MDEKARTSPWTRRLRAVGVVVTLVALAACSNPLGIQEDPDPSEHTTSSGNHTTSSGNVSPRGR